MRRCTGRMPAGTVRTESVLRPRRAPRGDFRRSTEHAVPNVRCGQENPMVRGVHDRGGSTSASRAQSPARRVWASGSARHEEGDAPFVGRLIDRLHCFIRRNSTGTSIAIRRSHQTPARAVFKRRSSPGTFSRLQTNPPLSTSVPSATDVVRAQPQRIALAADHARPPHRGRRARGSSAPLGQFRAATERAQGVVLTTTASRRRRRRADVDAGARSSTGAEPGHCSITRRHRGGEGATSVGVPVIARGSRSAVECRASSVLIETSPRGTSTIPPAAAHRA